MEKIIEPIPERLIKLIDENRGELSREEFIKISIHNTLNLSSKEENIVYKKDEFGHKGNLDRMWLFAFLSYGIGDIITSYISFTKTGLFGDPIIQFLFARNFYPVIPFKITILFLFLLISYYFLKNKPISLFIPIIISILGLIFIFINFLYIISD